jgi:hypothetical protein
MRQDKKITDLQNLTYQFLSINDLLEIVDVSEEQDILRNKQIAIGEFLTYLRYNASYVTPFRVVVTPAASQLVISFSLPVATTSTIDNNKVYLYKNGQLLNPGAGADYTTAVCCANAQINVTLAIATSINDVYQLIYWP